MTKKKTMTDQVDAWTKGIDKMFERQREIDHELSPSKGEIRYIVDYAREVLAKASRIETVSALTHEDVITFEKAQSIIDWQKKQLAKDIEYLRAYLGLNEEVQ